MSDRTNFDIIKRYKKMKSINQICKENNIRASNVDIEGKVSKEKQEKVKKEIIIEVTKMYYYLTLGVDF